MSQSASTASSSPKSCTQRRGTLYGVHMRLMRMLTSGDSADVQFSVGQHFGPAKIFRAHKCVLSSASDVFHTMFNGNEPEKCDGPIDIPEIHPKAFNNMLKYIYVDVESVTPKNAYPTLKCADKYDLTLLFDSCFECILGDLTAENRDANQYLQHLESALTWAAGIESVVENCLHYVDVHCEEIFKSERFTELQPKTLQMILKRDTLFAEENIIYLAVKRWVLALCTRKNLEPTPQNRRQVLGDMFFLIRFPLMTDTQLADGPLNDLLLSPQDLAEIYCYKHATTKLQLRFLTQPRGSPVIRAGDSQFNHEEEVFCEGLCLSTLDPALVIGAHGSKIGVSINTDKKDFFMEQKPAEVIRASDFLITNQDICYRSGGIAKYNRLEEGSHIITINGKEQKAEFRNMFLEQSQVDAWKEAKISPTRKRPLDAADLA